MESREPLVNAGQVGEPSGSMDLLQKLMIAGKPIETLSHTDVDSLAAEMFTAHDKKKLHMVRNITDFWSYTSALTTDHFDLLSQHVSERFIRESIAFVSEEEIRADEHLTTDQQRTIIFDVRKLKQREKAEKDSQDRADKNKLAS